MVTSMSAGLQFQDDACGRPLQEREMAILKKLLGNRGGDSLDKLRAVDLNDGDMGSIRFQNRTNDKRHFGSELARAQYNDSDGILVSITLNADKDGHPFEMDFWRVDFSPLRTYPSPDQLIL